MFENPILHFIEAIYGKIIKIGSNFQSLFLLWMRITWGHQFFLAGLNKFHNMDQTVQFFSSVGILHPAFHAYVVTYVELIGGILLVLGLASRLAAIPLLVVMVTALTTVHINIFERFRFALEPSVLATTTPYPFLITAFLVLFFGPGRISLDAWLKHWAEGQPKY